ncbi:hypothetical protein ACIPJG_31995 [Streptomyces halstedii]|uniref:hypothetical protein n=1 Tax=Streptomyces halstedii TaxID=1944 RepID=UPI00382E5EC2
MSGMSARDKIVSIFPTKALGEAVADEILGDHRRELSQEIERACRTLPEGSDWFSGMFDAAKLIEPKGEQK